MNTAINNNDMHCTLHLAASGMVLPAPRHNGHVEVDWLIMPGPIWRMVVTWPLPRQGTHSISFSPGAVPAPLQALHATSRETASFATRPLYRSARLTLSACTMSGARRRTFPPLRMPASRPSDHNDAMNNGNHEHQRRLQITSQRLLCPVPAEQLIFMLIVLLHTSSTPSKQLREQVRGVHVWALSAP